MYFTYNIYCRYTYTYLYLMPTSTSGTSPRRANTAHVRQSRQDSSLGVQVKVPNTFQACPSSL